MRCIKNIKEQDASSLWCVATGGAIYLRLWMVLFRPRTVDGVSYLKDDEDRDVTSCSIPTA